MIARETAKSTAVLDKQERVNVTVEFMGRHRTATFTLSAFLLFAAGFLDTGSGRGETLTLMDIFLSYSHVLQNKHAVVAQLV